MTQQLQTHKQRKLAGQAFHALMDRQVLHVRVPDRDATVYVHSHGTAQELHGELGCCTCCHGGDTQRARQALGRGTHRE